MKYNENPTYKEIFISFDGMGLIREQSKPYVPAEWDEEKEAKRDARFSHLIDWIMSKSTRQHAPGIGRGGLKWVR